MAGGCWKYIQYEIKDNLDEIIEDIEDQFPEISKALREINEKMITCLNQVDEHCSKDITLANPARFDRHWANILRGDEEI